MTTAPLALLVLLQGLTGFDVAKRAHDEIIAGFSGERIDSTMILFDQTGNKAVSYKLNTLLLEAGSENAMTAKFLIRFLDPADSKGTALLSHEKKSGEESRWLYMSETKEVKRIGSANRSSSFKGSEISYEDLAIDTLDKYTYELVGETDIEGRRCYQVAAKPRFPDSGYSRIVSYYDQERLYVVRTDFFDKAGQPLKVSVYRKFEKVDGKWRAHLAEVSNLQTKKKTVVVTQGIKLHLKLSDSLFTTAQLQKN